MIKDNESKAKQIFQTIDDRLEQLSKLPGLTNAHYLRSGFSDVSLRDHVQNCMILYFLPYVLKGILANSVLEAIDQYNYCYWLLSIPTDSNLKLFDEEQVKYFFTNLRSLLNMHTE